MPRIAYQNKRFNQEHRTIIEHADRLLRQYARDGYQITLRGLYYRFISLDLFPDAWADENGVKNRQQNYKKLGDIISAARRAGMLDWDHLQDITRNVETPSWWSGPQVMVSACADQYDVDWWANQDWRPEVWVEKDALVGVIEVACRQWRCPYVSCRGYTSDSMIWASAQRLARVVEEGKTPLVIHLGDHDPSGIDMSRDIRERLELFSENQIEVKRIALNMDQIEQYDPPPNPAKTTDSRYAGYRREHGDESWELDALEPHVLTDLINLAMEEVVDRERWEESQEARDEGRRKLRGVADDWNNITEGM